jgi:hypothetical protein
VQHAQYDRRQRIGDIGPKKLRIIFAQNRVERLGLLELPQGLDRFHPTRDAKGVTAVSV